MNTSLPLQAIAPDVCVAPQLTPDAMAEAARVGFRSVVNNRPDFEEGASQPTNTQIEAARVAMTRNMKRKGKMWVRIFPDKSVTARPPETRMGKGKGQPEYWVATVRPGNVLFEIDGIPETLARESLRLAADKLPVRTKFLTRHN